MARLVPTGSTFQMIRGGNFRLAFVANRLNKEFGLKIDCNYAELDELHFKVSMAIGRYLQEIRRPTVNQVKARLASVRRAIELLEEILTLERSGFHGPRHSDDTGAKRNKAAKVTSNELEINLEAWSRLRGLIADAPHIGSIERSSAFIEELLDQLELLKHACLAAEYEVSLVKGKRGRDQLVWYDILTSALAEFSLEHKISPTVSTDRHKQKHIGPFYRLAHLTELILPKGMHSSSPGARVSRLRRGLAQWRKTQKPKS